MALTLERIVYDKDSGSEAIKKLDRNQRMIVNDSANLGVQVADTVTSIETGANYNTIKVTKNDGTNEIISTNGITSYNNLSDLPDLSLKADKTEVLKNAGIINGVDINTICNTGTQGYCVSCSNTPTGMDGTFMDYQSYPTIGYQEFTPWNEDRKFFRRKTDVDGAWNPWQELATTTGKVAVAQRAVENVAFPLNRMSVEDLNNPNYASPYENTISDGEALRIGLPQAWYHIKYFRHLDNNGFGVQVAYGLSGTQYEWRRHSTGMSWSPWIKIADTYAVNLVLDNGIQNGLLNSHIIKTGYSLTFYVSFLCSTGSIPSGTIVAHCPSVSFQPNYNTHLFLHSYAYDLPYYARLWIRTDGWIEAHGLDNVPANTIFDGSVTVFSDK